MAEFSMSMACSVRQWIVQVDYPNATHSWLYGINTAGTLVGSFSKLNVVKGFKLYNGKYMVIKFPMRWPYAEAINDNGVVVGSLLDGTLYHGFTWQNGAYRRLTIPTTRYGTVLTDVNNAGVIVGNHLSADWAFDLSTRTALSPISCTPAEKRDCGGINGNGLISGQIYFSQTNTLGYTAVC